MSTKVSGDKHPQWQYVYTFKYYDKDLHVKKEVTTTHFSYLFPTITNRVYLFVVDS